MVRYCLSLFFGYLSFVHCFPNNGVRIRRRSQPFNSSEQCVDHGAFVNGIIVVCSEQDGSIARGRFGGRRRPWCKPQPVPQRRQRRLGGVGFLRFSLQPSVPLGVTVGVQPVDFPVAHNFLRRVLFVKTGSHNRGRMDRFRVWTGFGPDHVQGVFGAGHGDIKVAELFVSVIDCLAVSRPAEHVVGVRNFFSRHFQHPFGPLFEVFGSFDINAEVAGRIDSRSAVCGGKNNHIELESFGFVHGHDLDHFSSSGVGNFVLLQKLDKVGCPARGIGIVELPRGGQ